MTKAVCALEATSRWAVTGTPIQNRLPDLATLFTFLSAYPYSNRKRFESDISDVWKAGNAEEAVRRLKRLAGCLILRRTNSAIGLPPRQDLQCLVEFTAAERSLYDAIRNQVVTTLDALLVDTGDSPKPGQPPCTYANILQQINAMRMVCNLGVLYHDRHRMPLAPASGVSEPTTSSLLLRRREFEEEDSTTWQHHAQQIFNIQQEMGGLQCRYCATRIDVADNPFNDSDSSGTRSQGQAGQAWLSRCLQFVCSDCATSQDWSSQQLCEHNPACPFALVSQSPASLEGSLAVSEVQPCQSPMELPSKVAKLVVLLRQLPPGTKRYTPTRRPFCPLKL